MSRIDLTRYRNTSQSKLSALKKEVTVIKETPEKGCVQVILDSDPEDTPKKRRFSVASSHNSDDSIIYRPKKVKPAVLDLESSDDECGQQNTSKGSSEGDSMKENGGDENKDSEDELTADLASTSKVLEVKEEKFKVLKNRNPNVSDIDLSLALKESNNDVFKAERIIKQAKALRMGKEMSPTKVTSKYKGFISALKKDSAVGNKVSMVDPKKRKPEAPDFPTGIISSDEEDNIEKRKIFPVSAFFSKPSMILDPKEMKKKLDEKLNREKKRPEKKPRQPKQKRRFIVEDDSASLRSSSEEDADSFINDDSESDVEDIDDEEIISARVKRRQRRTAAKEKNTEVDEIMAMLDDEDEYQANDILVGSSSEDDFLSEDEEEERGRKTNKRKPTVQKSFKMNELKENVLKFMNEASSFDLETIQGVSKKKAETLMFIRPFPSYDEMRQRLNETKGLDDDIINKALEAMKSRDVVKNLMSECQAMSNRIRQTVENLKEAKQPLLLNSKCTLKEYQLLGLNWLVLMHEKEINGILADEMGLGKTIQVIALLAFLKESRDNRGPHLIIVPASTLDNWDRELSLWCPQLDVLVYHGSQDERAVMRDQIFQKKLKYEVMLTTYQMVFGEDSKKLFKKTLFKYAIFDEAHMLKNMKTQRYEKLIRIRATRRLLLTGTPLQNNLLELMSLLIFTMPDLFHGKTDQIKSMFAYNNFRGTGSEVSKSCFEQERIDHAKKIMKPFILRRLKADVLKQLPKKEVVLKKISMTSTQEKKYKKLISSYHDDVVQDISIIEDVDVNDDEQTIIIRNNPSEKRKGITPKAGQSMMMNLRKVANHPLLIRSHYTDAKLRQMAKLMLKEPTHRDANVNYVFEDMEIMSDFELHELCLRYNSLKNFKLKDNIILDAGKLKELDQLLPSLKEKKKKVLIFSQFKMVLDILEAYLKIRDYHFLRLDGSTRIEDRLDLIDDFNSSETETFVFLLTTKAGGVGINLTAATTAIIHDIDFNPYNDKQAEDRCHRVGQTSDVTVYKLVTEDSIEEGILRMANEKLKLGDDLCAVNNNNRSGTVTKRDMKNLLQQALGL